MLFSIQGYGATPCLLNVFITSLCSNSMDSMACMFRCKIFSVLKTFLFWEKSLYFPLFVYNLEYGSKNIFRHAVRTENL